MLGYRLECGSLCLGELEDPTVSLDDDEIVVRVEFACIEPAPLSRGKPHCCPGGGLVGLVTSCGNAASAFAGLRVLVPAVIGCGECHTCRRGAAPVCPNRIILGIDIHGGCAESIVCAARWVTKLGAPLDLDGPTAAVLTGPALLAYTMYCRAGLSTGDTAIVLGLGPTAGILAKLALVRGVKVARANMILDEDSAKSVAQQLKTLDAADRPQKIFVCEGVDVQVAVQLAHPASSIVSCSDINRDLDLAKVLDRELTWLSVNYGHPDLLPEIAASVAKGELDLDEFIVQSTPSSHALEQCRAAFDHGKVLILDSTTGESLTPPPVYSEKRYNQNDG